MSLPDSSTFSNRGNLYVFDHVRGIAYQTSVRTRYMSPESLCPDLLGLDYIGEADHLRGRVVRAFFWIMRLWPKPRAWR